MEDIWRQTKDFNVVPPAEVERSVVDIEMYALAFVHFHCRISTPGCRLFRKIENFFNCLEKEKVWQRIDRQDRHKSQVEEYGRLLDEAISLFSVRISLNVHITVR
jgi:hypothetical protein